VTFSFANFGMEQENKYIIDYGDWYQFTYLIKVYFQRFSGGFLCQIHCSSGLNYGLFGSIYIPVYNCINSLSMFPVSIPTC